MDVIHWGGGANIRTKTSTVRWAHGFPCCCVGDRAIRIAREGRQTFDPALVTCKGCLRGMSRDPSIAVKGGDGDGR